MTQHEHDSPSAAQSRLLIGPMRKELVELLSQVFAEASIKARCAASESELFERLAGKDGDIVIVAPEKRNESALSIVAKIKKHPSVKVVLLSDGEMSLEETVKAYESGVDAFFRLPLRPGEILETLSALTGQELQVASPALCDHDFANISLEEFGTQKALLFDVYVRLSAQKYVKIAHAGETLSRERLRGYEQKGVQRLYVEKKDFDTFVREQMREKLAARQLGSESIEKRLTLLKDTGELLAQSLHLSGVNESNYALAADYVNKTVEGVTETEGALSLLSILASNNNRIYAHSVGVCLYSVMLARQLEWSSDKVLAKIGMGALLHDIGLKEVPESIFLKPRTEWTSEEARLYESHVTRGRDILSVMPSIPTDVIQIVYQHHEDCLGTGYPLGLKRDRIHPFARLVAVIDVFLDLALGCPDTPEKLSPREAITRMHDLYEGSLDPQLLFALSKLFVTAEGRIPDSIAS